MLYVSGLQLPFRGKLHSESLFAWVRFWSSRFATPFWLYSRLALISIRHRFPCLVLCVSMFVVFQIGCQNVYIPCRRMSSTPTPKSHTSRSHAPPIPHKIHPYPSHAFYRIPRGKHVFWVLSPRHAWSCCLFACLPITFPFSCFSHLAFTAYVW